MGPSQSDSRSFPVRFPFDASPIPVRFTSVMGSSQSDSRSFPVRFPFDASPIPVRFPSDSRSLPVRAGLESRVEIRMEVASRPSGLRESPLLSRVGSKFSAYRNPVCPPCLSSGDGEGNRGKRKERPCFPDIPGTPWWGYGRKPWAI